MKHLSVHLGGRPDPIHLHSLRQNDEDISAVIHAKQQL